MVIFLKQVTLVKEVYLKRIYNFFIFIFFINILFFFNSSYSKELTIELKKDVIIFLESIKEFSSEFIQTDGQTIEEGFLFIKNDRIKIQYNKPKKITIIIDKNKAMYFNEDLQEIEYFNPKNSIADYFYQIFNNQSFFDDAGFIKKNNFITINKKIKLNDSSIHLKIFFEDSPFLLRKISIIELDNEFSISFINPNYNPGLESDFFSMANPLIN